MDTTEATARLILQILDTGFGATSLAIVLWSVSPRLKRVSRRVLKLERSKGIVTPPRGVPVDEQDFDDNTAH